MYDFSFFFDDCFDGLECCELVYFLYENFVRIVIYFLFKRFFEIFVIGGIDIKDVNV